MGNNQSVCAIKEKVEILRGSNKQNMFSTTEIINAFDELFSVIANQATDRGTANILTKIYAKPSDVPGLAFFLTLRIVRAKPPGPPVIQLPAVSTVAMN